MKQSNYLRVQDASKTVYQFIPVPLEFNIPEGTDWNTLRVKSTNARLDPNTDVALREMKMCPQEGKRCAITLLQVMDEDTNVLGVTEYNIEPYLPKATFAGVSGQGTLSREAINRSQGIALQFEDFEERPSGGVITFDLIAMVGDKEIKKNSRSDRFTSEMRAILRQKQLTEIKIENIQAKYGCVTSPVSLESIWITVQ